MGILILISLAGPDCPFMGRISGGARKFTWAQEQLATMGRFSYFPAGVKTDHSMLYWGCKYATLTLSRNSSTKTFVFKNHFYLILHYKIKIMLQFPLDQLFFGRSCSILLFHSVFSIWFFRHFFSLHKNEKMLSSELRTLWKIKALHSALSFPLEENIIEKETN